MAEDHVQQLTTSYGEENLEETENRTTEEEIDQDAEILPSQVTETDYIYMPSSFENFEEKEEWKSGGKWLLFNQGDFKKLDFWWIQLQPLVADETILCIKSSTAANTQSQSGVLMCYTPDCENRSEIKKAADAIRNAVDFEYLMYYKTNEASDSGLYKMHGDNQITKYMHTVACSLYERDKNKGWKKIIFD